MRRVLWAAGLGMGLLGAQGLVAQSSGSKSEAEIKKEDRQAQALYDKQNFVAALPLYEDLHQQRPESPLFQERLAMSLLATAAAMNPAEQAAARKRAKELLLQAKSNGDNSGLLQTLLEKLGDDPGNVATGAKPAGQEWVDKGEAAFSSGDLQGAVRFYEKALEVNPRLYAAALFAGDAEFKLGHPAEAGKWFAQAIVIDPDTETAYRYWGDSLEKNAEHQRAEEEFIEAIVAAPYQRAPRIGLKQWADKNHAMIVPPPIKLPARATETSEGHINITMSPGGKDVSANALDLAYSMESALWQGDEVKKHFPAEKTYRHSLLEETTSVRLMLTVASETKVPKSKLSPSLKLLSELDKKGMLECWILLDDPDQGIAQDYVAFRKEHRALRAKYIAEYDVHPM